MKNFRFAPYRNVVGKFLFPFILSGASATPLGSNDGKASVDAGKGCALLEQCEPKENSPEIWGDLGSSYYATGSHMAPNGVPFRPVFSSDLNLNLGLLSRKRLYLFTEDTFWAQRASAAVTNSHQGSFDFSKREVDLHVGLAWNVFNRFELRSSYYALNNLNRGTSEVKSSGFKDGSQVEGRYYFGPADIFDVGRLSFVSLGYYPTKTLVGGNGEAFEPGLFTRTYVTWDVPLLRSYLFADGQVTGQKGATPRLLTLNAGVATRPMGLAHNLEFRVGDEVTDDVRDGATRNLVYFAFRIDFQADPRKCGSPDLKNAAASYWPEVWGELGSQYYFTGSRVAPNGVPFRPVFSSDLNLNIGLLSKKKLYLFTEDTFWAQRASAGVTNSHQGSFDFSKREVDLHVGLAARVFYRFEVRASYYALTNLNRGDSNAIASGGKDGTQVETRYYLPGASDFDVDKLGFISLGYYPTKTLVGGNGTSFEPGVFARAYLTRDIPCLRSFIYGDGQFTAERGATPRLLTFDAGIATRPFPRLGSLEFRLGDQVTRDVKAADTRNLVYLGARVLFGN